MVRLVRQEDLGAGTLGREAADFARGRLANVADTVDGKLDPAEYLKKGRHGEWTLASGAPRLFPLPSHCTTCALPATWPARPGRAAEKGAPWASGPLALSRARDRRSLYTLAALIPQLSVVPTLQAIQHARVMSQTAEPWSPTALRASRPGRSSCCTSRLHGCRLDRTATELMAGTEFRI